MRSRNSSSIGRALRLPHHCFPCLIFVLALGIRLAYLLQIDASPLFAQPTVDAETYTRHAARLAGGNWLGHEEGPFWQPPLYPYFLGLVQGIFPGAFFYAARFFQMFLGALSCVLIWWIGRQMFTPKVGNSASLVAAFYGPFIYYDGELLPASLGVFLVLAGLGLLVRSLRHASYWGFMGAGAVFGLACLNVATALCLVAGGAAWLACRRAPHQAGVFLLGAALTIAPVTWRNWAIGHDQVLISSNAGVNFYIGNNPDYERTLGLRPGWEWEELTRLPLRAGIEQPSLQSRFFLNKAWDTIRSEPFEYLRLLIRKTFLFWHGNEVGRNLDVYFWRNYSPILAAVLWKAVVAFPFGIIGPAALLGMLLAIRRQGLSLPVVFTATYTLGVIAFFVAARYRLPVVPLLLLFAAFAADSLYCSLRERRWGSSGAALALLVAFAVLANWRLSPMNMQGDATIHYNLGIAHARQGLRNQARLEFTRAYELDPTHWEARYSLGFLHALAGDIAGAAEIFAQVREAHLERPEVSASLAHAYQDLGNWVEAARVLQESLRAEPRQRQAYAELLGIYMQAGDFRAAEKLLQQAARYYPQEAEEWRSRFGSVQENTKGR